jgi:hypothetical protein
MHETNELKYCLDKTYRCYSQVTVSATVLKRINLTFVIQLCRLYLKKWIRVRFLQGILTYNFVRKTLIWPNPLCSRYQCVFKMTGAWCWYFHLVQRLRIRGGLPIRPSEHSVESQGQFLFRLHKRNCDSFSSLQRGAMRALTLIALALIALSLIVLDRILLFLSQLSCFVFGWSRDKISVRRPAVLWGFSRFFSVPPGKFQDITLQLGHECFLSDPIHVIIHLFIRRLLKSIVKLTTNIYISPSRNSIFYRTLRFMAVLTEVSHCILYWPIHSTSLYS